MQWILKDVGKRKKYVVEVLEPVRFPLLPAQRLLKYIESKRKKEYQMLVFEQTMCCAELRDFDGFF